MAMRSVPAGAPRFGHCFDLGGAIVGVLLEIYSLRETEEGPRLFCHLSSWCVDEPFRAFAPALSSVATRRKDATYVNISPARHTRLGIEALGYRRYVKGQMAFAPLLTPAVRGARITKFDEASDEARLLNDWERQLLADHQQLGCMALVGVDEGAWPFVLVKDRVVRRLLPCAEVLYCRDHASLARFARPLGRLLAKEGVFFALVDANAPVPKLIGAYVPGRAARYSKGGTPPQVGDLAYSERAILDSKVEPNEDAAPPSPKGLRAAPDGAAE